MVPCGITDTLVGRKYSVSTAISGFCLVPLFGWKTLLVTLFQLIDKYVLLREIIWNKSFSGFWLPRCMVAASEHMSHYGVLV